LYAECSRKPLSFRRGAGVRSGDGDRRIRAVVERRRAVLADRDRLRVGDRLRDDRASDVAEDRAAGDVESKKRLTAQVELLSSGSSS
jgi:hypothetical protein